MTLLFRDALVLAANDIGILVIFKSNHSNGSHGYNFLQLKQNYSYFLTIFLIQEFILSITNITLPVVVNQWQEDKKKFVIIVLALMYKSDKK